MLLAHEAARRDKQFAPVVNSLSFMFVGTPFLPKGITPRVNYVRV
jgi:hypothetical protein